MESNVRSGGSSKSIAALLIVIALAFIVAPLAVPSSIIEIDWISKAILLGFGVLLIIIAGIMMTITHLYRKAASDEAFVKTGMGGQKAIIDGGAIIVPFLHEVIPVSLQTIRLKVERFLEAALITGDFLRADIAAEFYIKVKKEEKDVVAAATSLGEKASDHGALEAWVTDKLVNALRTVAATKTLDELNKNREEFATAVLNIVQVDLQHNGLTLESVTISKLDQTPTSALRPDDNVFDAQGARRIAEITNESRIARNEIEQTANQKVELKKVDTSKQLYSMEVDRATAEAEKDKNIQVARATASQEAATKAAEQSKLSGVAEISSQQAIAVASVEQEQAVAVANQAKEKAERTAEIEKEKSVEIASREKEISVAEAEKRRAEAQGLQLAAEKDRETAAQEVKTVTVTSEAERRKQQTIIEQQAEAEKIKINQNVEADVAAYTVIKQAEAEATAADKRSDAQIKLAEAAKQSRTLEAEGDTAIGMVPVNVNKAQVAVDQAKVEVTKAQLEAQTQNEKMAYNLQIDLAKIAAQRDVQIEYAKALGSGLAASNMTIYGTPETYQKMLGSFENGQQTGKYMEGMMDTMPPQIVDLATVAVSEVGRAASRVLKKVTGMDVPPEEVEKKLKEELQNGKPEEEETKSGK